MKPRTPGHGVDSWPQRNDDTGLSGLVRNVEDMTHNAVAEQFFNSYTRALLDRNAGAIAEHYAVPALIEFPEHPIAVSSASQTEQFFAGAFSQYEGVTTTHAAVKVVASTGHSIWVDVTWTHSPSRQEERFLYQLVRDSES